MATVQHSALTGSELHQPKGADSVAASTLIQADGAGNTSWVSPAKVDKVNAIGNSSTAFTVNMTAGNVHTVTLTDNRTATFSNPSATSGVGSSFTLIVTQDSTARTITWPAAVKWANGTAPTLSSGSADVDIFTFFTPDQGTTYYGFTAGQNMS